jgi:CRP-like cAMP-binding protein
MILPQADSLVLRSFVISNMENFSANAALLRQHIHRFVTMQDADWELLLPQLDETTLEKGSLFAEAGKKAHHIAFVLEGNLRQFYPQDDGEEKTTYFYFENHLMAAYISCITGQPSALSIEALTSCRLLVFRYEVLQQLYQKSMSWQLFGRLVAEWLAIGLEERMVNLLTLSPEQRYEGLLQSNKHKIIERIPQHYIANYLGITPVSLSRIRNRMNKK